METRPGLRSSLFVLAITFTLLSLTSAAAQENLFFVDAVEIPDSEPGKRTIEMDQTGAFYASQGKTIYKLSPNLTILEQRSLANEILSTSISPDSSKLAVTLRSPVQGIDSVFVLSTGDLSTLASSDLTESNAYLLQWSPNGAKLLTNAPENGIIELNRDNLEQEQLYTGNHTDDVVCLDVSKESGSILSVDVQGNVHLWNNPGGEIYYDAVTDSEVLDCKIEPNDQYFAVSTKENGIRRWTFSGTELKPIDFNNALDFEFGQKPNTLVIHTKTSHNRLVQYDIVNDEMLDQITIFHEFDDFVVVNSDTNTIKSVVFDSNVDYIVKYGNEVQRPGTGVSGIDTDGDGIPDSLDEDIDGDGIENSWDLNCIDIGIECEYLPDEDFMRTIDLYVNETHLNMRQTFTLNKQFSSSIRDLARFSLNDDIRLTSDETQHFADSICENINTNDASIFLLSQLALENASLRFDEAYCTIDDGMTLTPAEDRVSHIRYTIHYRYAFEGLQSIDAVSVDIMNHRFPSSGSITELSEQHPILIQIGGESIVSEKYSPWHVQEEIITFKLQSTQEDETIISPENLFNSPITYVVLLMGIIVIGVVTQRLYDQMTKSGYDIELDDEEDDALNEEIENIYEEVYEDEWEDDITSKPGEIKAGKRVVTAPSKQVAVRKKKKADAQRILEESSNEVVRKRKARKPSPDAIKTKRRKLSDTSTRDAQPRKRRSVKRAVQVEDEKDETVKRFVSESPKE